MKALRRGILTAAYLAQLGHVPSSLSILELVWCLYHDVMLPNDRFILSKGHGALALYATLGRLDDFVDGDLAGHPEFSDGIELTSGSLGHGLGVAAGMALGKSIAGELGRVFVLVGDGECQEGPIWEAVRIVSGLRLNVICIIDYNYSHPDLGIMSHFESYKWNKCNVDGHDLVEIRRSLMDVHGPLLVKAHTVKGYGVPEMMADPQMWHHRALTREDYERMVESSL